jgi:hypothetical protein
MFVLALRYGAAGSGFESPCATGSAVRPGRVWTYWFELYESFDAPFVVGSGELVTYCCIFASPMMSV